MMQLHWFVLGVLCKSTVQSLLQKFVLIRILWGMSLHVVIRVWIVRIVILHNVNVANAGLYFGPANSSRRTRLVWKAWQTRILGIMGSSSGLDWCWPTNYFFLTCILLVLANLTILGSRCRWSLLIDVRVAVVLIIHVWQVRLRRILFKLGQLLVVSIFGVIGIGTLFLLLFHCNLNVFVEVVIVGRG